MRHIRIYQPPPLDHLTNIQLTKQASHHVATVLRLGVGEAITLFDGENNEHTGVISTLDKNAVMVNISSTQTVNRESPIHIHLYQGLTRSDKMDMIIQKATELGVNEITPVYFERSQHKKAADRLQKKQEHWQKIAISACEQSGRNQLPELHPAIDLAHLTTLADDRLKLVLSPGSNHRLQDINPDNHKCIALVIGPEGGLSSKELDTLCQHEFHPLSLGPRVLRAETAAISGITLIQAFFGDL